MFLKSENIFVYIYIVCICIYRGLGVTLIVLVLILTCVFAYTATLIELPEETATLLPDDTNYGRVQDAISNMDIDETQFSGYSTSTGESTGAIVAIDTKEPTKSPIIPTPTQSPTAPTTATPTGTPTTPQPTPDPTDPSFSPSAISKQ